MFKALISEDTKNDRDIGQNQDLKTLCICMDEALDRTKC